MSELIYGPVTIFVAPIDTPIPETPAEALDPDGPWELKTTRQCRTFR
jgi:hypothetical protein